jgi:hypothetical protein
MSKIESYATIIPTAFIAFKENDSYQTLLNNLDLFTGMSNNELLTSLNLIIDEYNQYINSININIHYEIIIFLLGIIGLNNANPEEILNHILKSIYTDYLEKIIEYLEKINYSDKEADIYLQIVNKLIHNIYETILLLYSFRYYINIIPKILLKYTVKAIMPEDKYTNIKNTIQNFFSCLEHSINNGTFINIDYTNITTKETIYRYIINNFIKDILQVYNIFANFISIDIIISKINVITKIYEDYSKGLIILDNTKLIIIKLIIKLNEYNISAKKFIITKKNMYITLPQYENNCWYLSILTCMTFSDASKKLLIEKILLMYRNKKSIILSNADKELFNIILIIIETITSKFETYDVDKQINCDKLVYFKEGLMKYIYMKYNEFLNINNLKSIKITDEMLNKTIGYDEYLYYRMAYIYNCQEITSKTTIIPSGMDIPEYSLINSFYKIFNIKTLWIYNYNNSIYHCQLQNNNSNPDIIFIQLHDSDFFITNLETNPNVIIPFDKKKIRYNDDYSITFNDCNYELDYTIYLTDDTISNKTGSGHIISSIHYKGEQYYHDSASNVQKMHCGDKEITIPCPLVKFDWKKDIYFKSEFCIKQCFYNKAADTTESQIIKAQLQSENALCFNNIKNITLAYIKKK